MQPMLYIAIHISTIYPILSPPSDRIMIALPWLVLYFPLMKEAVLTLGPGSLEVR